MFVGLLVSCLRASVTIPCPDIGDAMGLRGGDTSAARLPRWPPINPSTRVSALRSRSLAPAPSTASLARIFRETGVARSEPRKKPRSAWRWCVYPAPNACWQLDATEYVLTGGRKCVIFQLIDDHSRYAVASPAAAGETAEDAIAVFDKAVAAHGVPGRLLTDNGLALNPSGRGLAGRLVAHVAALGTEAITGKPYKPTTQGKNERFHQTLFRYLDKQPLAATLTQLQAQIDAFDHIYNTQRPHQGLPGRITPLAAWEATPKADPPRPKPNRPVYRPPVPAVAPRPTPPAGLPAGTRVRTVNTTGTIGVDSVIYKIGVDHAFGQVLVVGDGSQPGDKITITDLHNEILAEHTRPPPGIRHIGNDHPAEPADQPRERHRSPDTPTVTDVLCGRECGRRPSRTAPEPDTRPHHPGGHRHAAPHASHPPPPHHGTRNVSTTCGCGTRCSRSSA